MKLKLGIRRNKINQKKNPTRSPRNIWLSEKESNPIPKEYLDAVAGEGMIAE